MDRVRFTRARLVSLVVASSALLSGSFGALVACSGGAARAVSSGDRGDGSANDAQGDALIDAPNDVAADAAKDAPSVADAGVDADAEVSSGPCALGELPTGAMVVDVTNVSAGSLTMAVMDAATYLAKNANDTYVIRLPAGNFDLSQEAQGNAVFDVSGIQPSQGRLIITGAGHTNTTLVVADAFAPTYGKMASHVCFVGMHFTKADYTVSQGVVVSTGANEIVLDIQPGFPSPMDLYKDTGQGYFLRQYTNSTSDPQLLGQYEAGVDQQVSWAPGTQISAQRWQLVTKQTPVWSPGDLIGIKAEPGQTADAGEANAAGAGKFLGCDDIVFNDILWSFNSHIQFDASKSIQFWNSRIERPAAPAGNTPCLSEPGGGPQFHNSGDAPGANTGLVISNFFADSTGDDSIAFFDDASATVTGSLLRNSFSKRCINVNASPNVKVDAFTTANAQNCMIVFQ